MEVRPCLWDNTCNIYLLQISVKLFLLKCRNIITCFPFQCAQIYSNYNRLKLTATLFHSTRVDVSTVTLTISEFMKGMTNTNIECIRPCLSALTVVKNA